MTCPDCARREAEAAAAEEAVAAHRQRATEMHRRAQRAEAIADAREERLVQRGPVGLSHMLVSYAAHRAVRERDHARSMAAGWRRLAEKNAGAWRGRLAAYDEARAEVERLRAEMETLRVHAWPMEPPDVRNRRICVSESDWLAFCRALDASTLDDTGAGDDERRPGGPAGG